VTKAHYSEALRIVKGRKVTLISRGGAACTQHMVDYTTHVRSEVTCKRCLRLIEAADNSPPMSGAELAKKHGFKPHGRDPLTGGVLLPTEESKP
jgi:hypothetical protein